MPTPMYISTVVTANVSKRSCALGSRCRHSTTASVAISEMPTSEAVEVIASNTAESPRLTYPGTTDSERDVLPAGSCPHTSHHQTDANDVGTVAIAAAFQRRRITVNSSVPTM